MDITTSSTDSEYISYEHPFFLNNFYDRLNEIYTYGIYHQMIINWMNYNDSDTIYIDDRLDKIIEIIIKKYNNLQDCFISVFDYCKKKLSIDSINTEKVVLTRDMFPTDSYDNLYNFICLLKKKMIKYVNCVHELFDDVKHLMTSEEIKDFEKRKKDFIDGNTLIISLPNIMNGGKITHNNKYNKFYNIKTIIDNDNNILKSYKK